MSSSVVVSVLVVTARVYFTTDTAGFTRQFQTPIKQLFVQPTDHPSGTKSSLPFGLHGVMGCVMGRVFLRAIVLVLAISFILSLSSSSQQETSFATRTPLLLFVTMCPRSTRRLRSMALKCIRTCHDHRVMCRRQAKGLHVAAEKSRCPCSSWFSLPQVRTTPFLGETMWARTREKHAT